MIYEDYLAGFTDYKPITLYWQRFSIAEHFGTNEIKQLYNDIFKDAKNDYKLLTELVMVTNHKSWQHHDYANNPVLCKLYADLYNKADKYACEHLTGEELDYFLSVTD